MSHRRLVIGIGNPHRGDDAAGIAVTRLVSHARVEEVSDCSLLVMMWADEEDVTVIDATVSGAEPGTVTRFDGLAEALPTSAFASTHSFGLAESIELSRALRRLPRTLTIYGIEAGRFDHGEPLSPEVERGVRTVVTLVNGEDA